MKKAKGEATPAERIARLRAYYGDEPESDLMAGDVVALCDRVETLEAALREAESFIADDTCRHNHEKALVLLVARAALGESVGT